MLLEIDLAHCQKVHAEPPSGGRLGAERPWPWTPGAAPRSLPPGVQTPPRAVATAAVFSALAIARDEVAPLDAISSTIGGKLAAEAAGLRLVQCDAAFRRDHFSDDA